jgi:hypothetical protein
MHQIATPETVFSITRAGKTGVYVCGMKTAFSLLGFSVDIECSAFGISVNKVEILYFLCRDAAL